MYIYVSIHYVPGLTEAVLGALAPTSPCPPPDPHTPQEDNDDDDDSKHLSPIEEVKCKEESPRNNVDDNVFESDEKREAWSQDFIVEQQQQQQHHHQQQQQHYENQQQHHHQQQQQHYENQQQQQQHHENQQQQQQEHFEDYQQHHHQQLSRHSYDTVAVTDNACEIEESPVLTSANITHQSYNSSAKSPQTSHVSPLSDSEDLESFGGKFRSEESLGQSSEMSQHTEISEVSNKDWKSCESLASVDKRWIRSVVNSDFGTENSMENPQMSGFGSTDDVMEVTEGSRDNVFGSRDNVFGSRESVGSTEKEMSIGSLDKAICDFDSTENLAQRNRSHSRDVMEVSEDMITETRQTQSFARVLRHKAKSPETENPDVRSRLKSNREGLAGSDNFEDWELGRRSGSSKSEDINEETEVSSVTSPNQFEPDLVVGQDRKEWVVTGSDLIEPEWVEVNQSEVEWVDDSNQFQPDLLRPEPELLVRSDRMECTSESNRTEPDLVSSLNQLGPDMGTMHASISPPKTCSDQLELDRGTVHEPVTPPDKLDLQTSSDRMEPILHDSPLNSNIENELIFQMDQTPESEHAPSWNKQLSDTSELWRQDEQTDVDADKILVEEDLDSPASDVEKWTREVSSEQSDTEKSLAAVSVSDRSSDRSWTPLRISSASSKQSSEEKERPSTLKEEKERQSSLKERRRIFESPEKKVHVYDEVPLKSEPQVSLIIQFSQISFLVCE